MEGRDRVREQYKQQEYSDHTQGDKGPLEKRRDDQKE